MIDLTIKTLDSQNHKFRVPDTFTILELKEHIADQVKVAVIQQRLIFCGRVLSNETKLADIGIDGKVMHLVQKLPRMPPTTSGSPLSSTTNTHSRLGPNNGPGFRGWHSHGHDPTVLFGAIGIPTELVHAGEFPRVMSARNHATGTRLNMALDMIRRSNEILNRLENPGSNRTTAQSSTADAEQFPEGSQQTEDVTGNVPSDTSAPPLPSDPDSVNVSYEVDETFPNTVVVTIDATHTMRMPPGLMRQMQNRLQGNNSSQNTTDITTENEVSGISPDAVLAESANQSSTEQMPDTLMSSATSEQNSRNDYLSSELRASELRTSATISDRLRLRELINLLNRLKTRLEPFYTQYCRYIDEDPVFESTEGDNGSLRAQTVYNGVSEVLHLISHIYHAMSDLRVSFARPRPRPFQTRPCMFQGAVLHHHQTFTTSSGTPPPPPSTQQPTSTQTTVTSQSTPSAPTVGVGSNLANQGGETPNVSTSATSTETNSNTTVGPNTESNNTSAEFSSDAPHGVELMFDLPPGSFRIDSVEEPSSGNETSNNLSMPIDWMDQMIDVISSGVRRPFVPEQSLDWSSIPTTSTRTPRVTPRTTDSPSSANSTSQGLSRGRWDSPRMDPFLPCNSHHFESNLRPMVLARRSTQGTDRSTSSATSGNSTTDTSTPTSPNEMRPFSVRRSGRPRARYVPDADGFLAGIHPIVAWGRNQRNINAVITNSQATGQGGVSSNRLGEQIRTGMGHVYDQVETEIDLDRVRGNAIPEVHLPPVSTIRSTRQTDELLLTPIGNIPYFRALEGRFIVVDLFLLIARNWTLYDMIHLNTISHESSIVQNPVSRNSEAIISFVLDRVMRNQPSNTSNIEEAANRIYLEMLSYINIFQCSVPTRTTINVNESFLRCIIHNLRTIVLNCEETRAGSSNSSHDVVSSLIVFAEGLLSLVVYCCHNCSIFRLCVSAIMQFLPLPLNLHRIIMDEVRTNIDRYWIHMSSNQMLSLSAVDHIVPYNTDEFEVGQTSRVATLVNDQRSTNPTLPPSENVNEPLPEVVIGSQEWHHSVPSEWVPVIARDSQRQRRQGTQPPYSDAYLSGMPNKRRKIVTNSKSQDPLSQIIAKNLEVAMDAAGVPVNKEVTASVGADTEVQNAYTERIRTFGRSGLDTHPDFNPNRYPNASKFFYDHNNPN